MLLLVVAGAALLAWLGVLAIVVGMCADAKRGDQTQADADQTLPLRRTWRPVRTRIFRSSHRDQPAT